MLVKMESMSGGGSVTTYYAPTTSEMRGASDATPFVMLRGNFSNAKAIAAKGYYHGNVSTTALGNDFKMITLGTTVELYMGSYNGSSAYRKVTVYPDRVEVGSGRAGTSVHSDYAIITDFVIGIE